MLKFLRRYSILKLILIVAIVALFLNVIKRNKRSDKTNNQLILLDKVQHGAKLNINLYNMFQNNEFEFDCIKTKKISTVQTTICLHDLQNDVFVSKALKNEGIWEEDLVTTFIRMFSTSSEIDVLDVGAQLGQYTLFAAKFGRQCVAVEPFYDSYIRLHKSALLEKTESMITLVVNGISDIGGQVKMMSQVKNNFGGQSIFGNDINYAGRVNESEIKRNKYLIETITLNDLVYVLPAGYKKVIMKIDIQNYEIRAFKKANILFETLDILAIFIEWDDKKNSEIFPNTNEIEEFLEFLYSKDYKARNPKNYEILNRKEWKIWPYDIIFVRSDFLF